MKKTFWIIGILVLVAALIYVAFMTIGKSQPQTNQVKDYKNISYMIEGIPVQLIDGKAEVESAPGSASKTITQYFGNELRTDLNNDGREDVVFLLTQNTGGSGTFYYVVAALNTPEGYKGSDGYVLGDRIAPQTVEVSKNPQHKQVIVVNFATRKANEPMTATPSVGRSAYIKLDVGTMQWGIVDTSMTRVTAGTLSLKVGETKKLGDLSLTLTSITEDSRCPQGVQCIWAGRVVAQVTARALGKTQTADISTQAESTLLDYYHISIEKVLPASKTDSSEYIVTFDIR